MRAAKVVKDEKDARAATASEVIGAIEVIEVVAEVSEDLAKAGKDVRAAAAIVETVEIAQSVPTAAPALSVQHLLKRWPQRPLPPRTPLWVHPCQRILYQAPRLATQTVRVAAVAVAADVDEIVTSRVSTAQKL